jgi:hypothetical protein
LILSLSIISFFLLMHHLSVIFCMKQPIIKAPLRVLPHFVVL